MGATEPEWAKQACPDCEETIGNGEDQGTPVIVGKGVVTVIGCHRHVQAFLRRAKRRR